MWLVNAADLSHLEDELRYRLKCDNQDTPLLRTASYISFRHRCLAHLAGGACVVPWGETLMLGNVTVLVLGSHPEGVLEVDILG